MKVFGIDPGSSVTGYGVVERRGGRLHYVESGCVRTRSDDPIAGRLLAIRDGLVEALRRTSPDAVAIESIFRHKSSESALKLGQARGVALLAIAECGFEPFEYNPMTVKRSVGAHGKADKKAISRMVRMILGADFAGPADVSDALAIAITHCAHARHAAAARAASASDADGSNGP